MIRMKRISMRSKSKASTLFILATAYSFLNPTSEQ